MKDVEAAASDINRQTALPMLLDVCTDGEPA
jgi:hypothetical protein